MKKMSIFLIGSLVCLLSGCVTLSALDRVRTRVTTKPSKIVTEDQLYAIGRIESPELLAEYPNAVAILGRNAVYVLVKGGDGFAEVSQKLDGSRLIAADTRSVDGKKTEPFELAVKDRKFTGTRHFYYDKPKSELTAIETKILQKFKAKQIGNKGSTLSIPFAGFIPNAPVRIQGAETRFKVERPIILREDKLKTTEEFDIISVLLNLPLTVIIDSTTLSLLATLELMFFIDESIK